MVRRAFWAALVLAGCEAGSYRVLVHVPGDPERAARVEVSVVARCSDVQAIGAPVSDPITRVIWTGGEAAELGAVEPGLHGLYGRAWDSSCALFAAGCDAVRLEAGGSGTIDVFLEEIPPTGCDARCVDGLCVADDAGTDAAVDSGADGGADSGADAGADSGVDAGADAGADAGVDAGTGADAGADAGVDAADAGADAGPSVVCEPSLVGSIEIPGVLTGVAVSGDYAYVAVSDDVTPEDSQLQVVDLTDPESPEIVRTVTLPDLPFAVEVSGEKALVAAFAAGLLLVDIADPTQAEVEQTVDTPGAALDVAVTGSWAVVADWTDGLQGCNLLGDQSPVVVIDSSFERPGLREGNSHGVVPRMGDLLVITATDLVVVPDPPWNDDERLGIVSTAGATYAVAASGTLAYVAEAWDGLEVIDVSDNTEPVSVATVDVEGGNFVDVCAVDQYAVVADAQMGGGGGVVVIRVPPSDPESASVVGSYAAEGGAARVAPTETRYRVAVLDYPGGRLELIDLDCSEE